MAGLFVTVRTRYEENILRANFENPSSRQLVHIYGLEIKIGATLCLLASSKRLSWNQLL